MLLQSRPDGHSGRDFEALAAQDEMGGLVACLHSAISLLSARWDVNRHRPLGASPAWPGSIRTMRPASVLSSTLWITPEVSSSANDKESLD